MNIDELNSLYTDMEAADAELFAEQRSNVLLVTGNHYQRRGKGFEFIRKNAQIQKQQKIRLTKNHIQKITKTYHNNLVSFAPGVAITPRQEAELSDQKAAELNKSVWDDLRERHKIKAKKRMLAKDLADIGEAVIKVFFDPNAGDFQGYEPVLDEAGQPVIGEDGEPAATPKFTGDLVFERFLPFNVLRDPEGKTWDECRVVCLRKMVSKRDLQKMYKGDEEKLKFVADGSEKTYQVFDGQSGTYGTSKDMLMVREFYFRSCADFPKGYYYIATEAGILHEGEIPLGVFPVLYCGFDEAPTSPRSFSIIKQLRPYQAEVNRCASKIAEHQVTLGDDKVILMNGGSMTPGGVAHGIKAVKVTGGSSPMVIQGRNGAQFLEYMNSQISEMYAISNVEEDSQEKITQVDPYALLFRGLREKKKFVIYGEKWEEFQVTICKTSLRLAKAYFPEDKMIPVFGKKEMVNIAEWKATDDLCYQITVEPRSEDAETIMGRQLSLNHLVQFAGPQMAQDDLGQLIRAMPYVNQEKAMSGLTIDSDNADNDLLRMDRGILVKPKKYENHQYMVKRLIHRMKQADFDFLPPETQHNYELKLHLHEQVIVMQEQAKQQANSGYIPSGGYLVSCDFFVPNADSSKLPKRARVPFEALQWLLQKLEAQGASQQALSQMNGQETVDLVQQGLGGQPHQNQGQAQPQSQGQGQGQLPTVQSLQSFAQQDPMAKPA